MNSDLSIALKNADTQKQKLDRGRPLSLALFESLNSWYRLELAYSSNALEGNTLTREETATVIEKGLTIGGKTIKEHLEAINHAHAFDYITHFASDPDNKISLQDIYSLHNLIMRDIDTKNAAALREVHIRISDVPTIFPDPIKIPELMNDFMAWLHSSTDHPIIKAADAHLKLLSIHPFTNGNARTARLVMNLLLMQSDYAPALILPEQRARYNKAIAEAQTTSIYDSYHCFILECIQKSRHRIEV